MITIPRTLCPLTEADRLAHIVGEACKGSSALPAVAVPSCLREATVYCVEHAKLDSIEQCRYACQGVFE